MTFSAPMIVLAFGLLLVVEVNALPTRLSGLSSSSVGPKLTRTFGGSSSFDENDKKKKKTMTTILRGPRSSSTTTTTTPTFVPSPGWWGGIPRGGQQQTTRTTTPHLPSSKHQMNDDNDETIGSIVVDDDDNNNNKDHHEHHDDEEDDPLSSSSFKHHDNDQDESIPTTNTNTNEDNHLPDEDSLLPLQPTTPMDRDNSPKNETPLLDSVSCASHETTGTSTNIQSQPSIITPANVKDYHIVTILESGDDDSSSSSTTTTATIHLRTLLIPRRTTPITTPLEEEQQSMEETTIAAAGSKTVYQFSTTAKIHVPPLSTTTAVEDSSDWSQEQQQQQQQQLQLQQLCETVTWLSDLVVVRFPATSTTTTTSTTTATTLDDRRHDWSSRRFVVQALQNDLVRRQQALETKEKSETAGNAKRVVNKGRLRILVVEQPATSLAGQPHQSLDWIQEALLSPETMDTCLEIWNQRDDNDHNDDDHDNGWSIQRLQEQLVSEPHHDIDLPVPAFPLLMERVHNTLHHQHHQSDDKDDESVAKPLDFPAWQQTCIAIPSLHHSLLDMMMIESDSFAASSSSSGTSDIIHYDSNLDVDDQSKQNDHESGSSSSVTLQDDQREQEKKHLILSWAKEQLEQLQTLQEESWLQQQEQQEQSPPQQEQQQQLTTVVHDSHRFTVEHYQSPVLMDFGTPATEFLDQLFCQLQQSQLSKDCRNRIESTVGDELRVLYHAHLQFMRNAYGIWYEQMLSEQQLGKLQQNDNDDNYNDDDVTRAAVKNQDKQQQQQQQQQEQQEQWNQMVLQITQQFRTQAIQAIPVMAQPGGIFRDMDLDYTLALKGLLDDIAASTELWSLDEETTRLALEAAEADHDSTENGVAPKKKKTWYRKLASRALVMGINYLQGWLAWQGIRRAALERERRFPKFPIF